MTFDPDRCRKRLLEYLISLARKSDFGEAFKIKALEGHASGTLDTALQCLLVGFFDIGRELLPKARAFVRAAIEHKERPPYYFRGATESTRLREFVLCQWLIEKRHDSKSLKQAVKHSELYLSEEVNSDRAEVQLALTTYLDAEEYAVLVNRFEKARLKSPKNLRQIKGEGTMSYVIARHRLGLEYTPEEVQAALESFLKRNVPVWLGSAGLFQRTAHWMKIAFWKPGDDPIATFLKCYDYLPGLTAPSYP